MTVYKKQAWPVVHVTGSEESPYQIVIARQNVTRGKALFLHVFDWLDDRTGHRLCCTGWGSNLIEQQFDSEEIMRVDITEEQMRLIDPEWYLLPENKEDDDE